MVRSVVVLDCMIVVTGYMSIVLYSRRAVVANFVPDRRCKIKDTLDLTSFYILHVA